ncbi:MAG TPA: GDP-mannose 4,6-dehydratase [Pseudonocardiaceae bacterium]|nr:GDP-mannose 4,6-dehydratase [Pseudonocardiaceae bacterium]
MATYIVTGACGFIGSNYVHFLTEHETDATVVAVDYLGFASNLPNLASTGSAVMFERADIADLDTMLDIYRRYQPDYVVNFAAESHNDRAILEPSTFMHSNATGAQVMLECSRLHPVRVHLHVSTIEVYGELPPGVPSFNESSPLNAKTPYSAAKAAGDQMARAYMQTYPAMNVRLTHCANNYGPYQLPEKLIPLAITNVLRGKKVPLYGDGLQCRDWLHVADHCAAIHAVLHADIAGPPPEAAFDPALLPIFDISARYETTNLDAITAVLNALDVTPEHWIEHVADRPNHDRRYLISPAKIEKTLGWMPAISFDDGIAETVKWYVDNRAWWEAVLHDKGDLQVDWAATV